MIDQNKDKFILKKKLSEDQRIQKDLIQTYLKYL